MSKSVKDTFGYLGTEPMALILWDIAGEDGLKQGTAAADQR